MLTAERSFCSLYFAVAYSLSIFRLLLPLQGRQHLNKQLRWQHLAYIQEHRLNEIGWCFITSYLSKL